MKLLSAVLYLDPDAVLYAQEPGSTEQRHKLLFLFWEVCGENLKIRISWDVGTPRYWIILYFLSDPNKNLKSRSCEIQPMPAEANWTVRNECNTIKWVLNLCEHCSSSGGLIHFSAAFCTEEWADALNFATGYSFGGWTFKKIWIFSPEICWLFEPASSYKAVILLE